MVLTVRARARVTPSGAKRRTHAKRCEVCKIDNRQARRHATGLNRLAHAKAKEQHIPLASASVHC